MGKKDILEKRLLEKNEVFADVFNNIVFGGKQVLNSAKLESISTESYTRKHNGTWRQGNRDIRKIDRDHQQYRLICGIENQENCDNTMPVRTMGYDYASYEEQIRELQTKNRAEGNSAYTKGIHDDQKLAPVVTTVLSFGENWEGPKSLHDLLDFPEEYREELKMLVPDYRLNLIRVEDLSDEVIGRLTSDFRFVAEFCAGRKKAVKLKALFAEDTRKIQYPEELLDLLAEVTGDKRFQEIIGSIAKKKGEEITMCTMVDELVQSGMEQGISLGRMEILELVKKMILNGEGELVTELSENEELLKQMSKKYQSL